jgi:hypothetical protein
LPGHLSALIDAESIIYMFKIIFYIAAGVAYAILFVGYAQQPILELLSDQPQLLIRLINLLFFLPIIIFGAFALAEYNKTKISEQQLKTAEINAFKELWAGKKPMWHAFWGYHIPTTIFVSVTANYAISRFSGQSLLLLILFFAMGFGYHVLTIFGTWRSANHYIGSTTWVVLTKIGVIFSSLCTALTLTLATLANYGGR